MLIDHLITVWKFSSQRLRNSFKTKKIPGLFHDSIPWLSRPGKFKLKSRDFPGFPWPVQTLVATLAWTTAALAANLCKVNFFILYLPECRCMVEEEMRVPLPLLWHSESVDPLKHHTPTCIKFIFCYCIILSLLAIYTGWTKKNHSRKTKYTKLLQTFPRCKDLEHAFPFHKLSSERWC
jgi:hypothetical protein